MGRVGEHTTSAPILQLRGSPKVYLPDLEAPGGQAALSSSAVLGSELPPDPTVFQKPTVPARALVITLILDGTTTQIVPQQVFCGNKVESVDSGVPFHWSFLPQGCSLCVLPQRFQFAPWVL